MANLATAVTVPNEIIKAVDFTFSHDQSINNIITAMQGILADPSLNLVIGGAVKPYVSGGMNVSIDPVYAYSGSNGIAVIETQAMQPISIETADSSSDRIDIIQIRGIEDNYDYQDRKFRDPETKVETIDNIATKKRIKLEINVKRGYNGSVSAPLTDSGFVKLAEISVPAGTANIMEQNIFNISAHYAGDINGNWTNEQESTFNPGHLTEFMEKFLVSHYDNGKIKDNSILAAMLKFGNDAGSINGGSIPTGLSMSILGQQFNALTAISQVLLAQSNAVDQANIFANDILNKLEILPSIPVAASTENIDIDTGGEKTIDGITCSIGQLVFLKDQEDPQENGFWQVQSGPWNRYPGFTKTTPAIFTGKLIQINNGSENAGNIYYLNNDFAKIGSDDLIFKESIFSIVNTPGKIPIRDLQGKINSPVFSGTVKIPTPDINEEGEIAVNAQWVNAKLHEDRDIATYIDYSYEPDPLELAKKCRLICNYQILKISLYQDLCDRKLVDPSINDTADYWYRCDEFGDRDINGLYFRVEDQRGMFRRGAGANAVKKGANATPYDGNAIGEFIGDAIRNMTGQFGFFLGGGAQLSPSGLTGAFKAGASGDVSYPSASISTSQTKNIIFDASLVVPTASENRPASISALVCITY